MLKVNNKNSRSTPDVVTASLLLTLNILHTFSMVYIDFEQVNVCIVLKKKTKSRFFRCERIWNLLVNTQNKKHCNKLYCDILSK